MNKKSKLALYVLAAILGLLMLYFLIPLMKLLCTEEGRAAVDSKVQSFGAFAPLAFIGVEIVQIVAAFVPGAPIEVMSGVLFGGFWGIIWCFTGIFAGTAIVFYLVRIFGRPLVYKLFPREKLETVKLLNDERRLTLTVFILFVIPGTPKDFLTYIAALTKIRPMKFFLTATIARTPSMACSVFMGANIGHGRFLTALLIFLIIISAGIAGYFLRKKYVDEKLLNTQQHDDKK